MDRLARRAVPDDDGLALIGDADARNLGRRDAGTAHCEAACRHHRLPDLVRIVLDPARPRVVLSQLALRDADDGEVAIEENGARRRRALVDGKDERRLSAADGCAFPRLLHSAWPACGASGLPSAGLYSPR